jgi:hypothetical protein
VKFVFNFKLAFFIEVRWAKPGVEISAERLRLSFLVEVFMSAPKRSEFDTLSVKLSSDFSDVIYVTVKPLLSASFGLSIDCLFLATKWSYL